MKQVTLENLHCESTEDWLGSDSCRVEVFTDGELEQSFRGDLGNGQDWPLGFTVRFARGASVRLFDEDTPDADDFLGEVLIGTELDGSGSGAFDLDGAAYQLAYTVADLGDTGPSDLVEAALQDFEASAAPGVWGQIGKAELLADVRATLADPVAQVYQASSNFCGPTSIVYALIRRSPRRYVRLCRQLYETGSFTSRSATVTASDGLRASQVGQSMTAADWMLIATMRESENAIFGVSADSSGVQSGLEGLTTHWEMEGWCGEILLCDTVDSSTTFVWGEFDAIRHAQQVLDGGGAAFVMLHADLLGADQDTVIPPWPTHWIVFEGGLAIDDAAGTIQFDYWTWGESLRLDVRTQDRFESCMFGTVTAF